MTDSDRPTPTLQTAGHAPANGLDVYYEIHGSALDSGREPVVLLPGGLMAIETAFAADLIPRFAQTHTVVAIEPEGHGHTADRATEPTIERLASDTVAVLDYLGIRRAHLVGHSLGGMIAVGVAIERPDLVATLAAVSVTSNLGGNLDELVLLQRDPTHVPSDDLIPLLPTEEDFATWRAHYDRVNPHPETFDAVVGKLNAMLTAWPGWTDAQLRSIQAPTLIAIGDNDFVRIEHAADMYRLIPRATLAVLPGTTHMSIITRGPWLESMVAELIARAT